ncbi:unnamed protein product [Jaminaea pallidilutea]
MAADASTKVTRQINLANIAGLGSGTLHRRYAPTAITLRVGSREAGRRHSLLDTGASISLIDEQLVQDLKLAVHPSNVQLDGIGTTKSSCFTLAEVWIDGQDGDGPCTIHCKHEFFVVKGLKPGIIIGAEFIDGQRIVIDLANSLAELPSGATLSLTKFKQAVPPPSVETSASANMVQTDDDLYTLYTTHEQSIPARSSAWVTCKLSQNFSQSQDLLAEPSLWCHEGLDQWLATPAALTTSAHPNILVTNFGHNDAVVPTNVPLITARRFSEEKAVVHMVSPPHRSGAPSADVTPFDERDDEDYLSPLANSDAATVKVDGHFNVGVDEKGQPIDAIVQVLRQRKGAFSLDGRPGHVDYPGMRIPISDPSKLSAEPPRKTSPEKRAVIEQTIADLLEMDVIEPSRSTVSYPVLLVHQNEKWRFCVDYRALNAVTLSDRYPLQRVDDIFETLRGATVFSALDAVKGYHQLDVHPDDRWLTAFTCHAGFFQYKRVPFGLKGAPAYFQRFMDTLLGSLRWHSAMVYLDDVVLFSKDTQSHAKALETLLKAAETAGLKFDPKKCHFALPSLKLLGRRICRDGVSVLESRVEAIKQLSPPKTLQEVQMILGLMNYYRAFIPRFASRVAPIQALLQGVSYKKKQQGSSPQKAVLLKDGLQADARTLQVQWGQEQNASFEDLKSALSEATTLSYPDYNKRFFLYIDASTHAFAAALHQQTVTAITESAAALPIDNSFRVTLPDDVEAEDLVKAQRDDPTWSAIIRSLVDGKPMASYRLVRDILIQIDDDLPCLPKALIKSVLQTAHAGHPGFARTHAMVSSRWFHPDLAQKVRAFCKHCPECIRTKLPRRSGEMDPSDVIGIPFHTISLDVMTGLPRSRGYDACLVIVDTFSKMILLEPITKQASGEYIATEVERMVLRRGWRPRRIISDSESRLVGVYMQALASKLGAVITPSAPYHQQANPVERYIQTAQNALTALCVDDGVSSWADKIGSLELALNSTPSTVTKCSPFELVYIHQPNLLEALTEHLGVGRMEERLSFSQAKVDQAIQAIRQATRAQSQRYNTRRAPLPRFEVGNLVMLRVTDHPIPGSRVGTKLQPKLEGPYRIKQVLSSHRVILDLPSGVKWRPLVDVTQLVVVPRDDEYGRPGLTADESDNEAALWEPQSIEGERLFNRRHKQYLIKWRNSTRLTWEFEEDLIEDGCQELINEYQDSLFRTPPLEDRPVAAAATDSSLDIDVPLHDHAATALDRPIRKPKKVAINGQLYLVVERPVAFSSKVTRVSEKNLAGPELELSGLAWAFQTFRNFLEGSPVTVITDHAPLQGILNAKETRITSRTLALKRQQLLPAFEWRRMRRPLPTTIQLTAPLDVRDDPDFHDHESIAGESTVLVDGHFNIGLAPGSDKPNADIVELIRSHHDAFSLDGKPGHVKYPGLKIPVPDTDKLNSEPPRKTSPEKRQVIDQTLEQLLAWDIIEPSQSSVSYPVLLVRQNGKWRFCVDYRSLNSATLSDRYPLARSDDTFETLGGACIFSALDAVKGYHQMEVDPDDRWKTAFACHQGLFQYKRVPFGLKGAPAYFQRFMDTLLGSLKWDSAMVYLDDVVVFNTDVASHLKSLDAVLTKAEEVGLRFDPKKCHFGLSSLKLLGRKISAAGVSVLPDRVKAIRDLAPPATYGDLHKVMGLFNYYRDFIPRYASRCADLEVLRRGITYKPKKNPNSKAELVTPDGKVGISDKVPLPWSDQQQRAFDDIKNALSEATTLVYPDPTKPYILYVDASKTAFAAALHQQHLEPTSQPSSAQVMTCQAVLELDTEEIEKLKREQAEDPTWSNVMSALREGRIKQGYALNEGLLIRTGNDTICLPSAAMSRTIERAHLGHWGFTRTLATVARSYYHPKLAERVRAWVTHCSECIRTKMRPRVGNLKPADVLGIPFHTISVDLMLGLPRVEDKDACLIVTDTFTKTTWLQPTTKSATAVQIADMLENMVIRRGFRPARIISDSDSKLIGSIGMAVARRMGAIVAPSTPHHQQANPVERYVQTAKRVLRALCVENGIRSWISNVPAAELALNTSVSTVTGYAPYNLLYATNTRILDHLEQHYGVSALEERLSFAKTRILQATDAIQKAQEEQKRRFDHRRQAIPNYEIGDLVMIRLPDRPLPQSRMGNKLEAPLEGPFAVKKIISDHTLELDLPQDM